MRPTLIEGTAEVDSLDAFLGTLDAIADETGCTVQAFDAQYLTGPDHLRRALRLADRAFERGENVARDRGVEWLLYAAGRRQIDDALTMGVSEGTLPVVVGVAHDGNDGSADDAREAERAAAERVAALLVDARDADGPFRATEPARIREFFDVSDRELDATDGTLADNVAERVALLDVEK